MQQDFQTQGPQGSAEIDRNPEITTSEFLWTWRETARSLCGTQRHKRGEWHVLSRVQKLYRCQGPQ